MFRTTRSKTASGTSARSVRRRDELRRTLGPPTLGLRSLLRKPQLLWTGIILAVFLAGISLTVAWSRDQVKVRVGQIMVQNATKRLDYQVVDEQATLDKRKEARESSPRVYRLNESYLNRLEAALLGLPTAVSGKTTISEISDELRNEFDLNQSSLEALHLMGGVEGPSLEWKRWVNQLVREQLPRNPLLRSAEFQVYTTTLKRALLRPDGSIQQPLRAEAIDLPPDPSAVPMARLGELITNAGFPPHLATIVGSRLAWQIQPTLQVDEQQTTQLAEMAAAAVPPEIIRHKAGELLYRRGEVLTPKQFADVEIEMLRFEESATMWQRWHDKLGMIGLIALVTLFLGSFATIAYPRIVRNPLRMAAICLLIGSMIAATVLVTAYSPMFLFPAAIGPTLFAAIILLVAYDQRLALLLGGIHCMLVTLALDQSVAFFILLIAGCATAIAQLREVRHRNTLIRAAIGTAAVLGVGTILLGILEMPPSPGTWERILVMAVSAVLTTLGVSFVVLGILPSVERLFDITTGMTLAELRDPKQPLLRQLQQRAPGTYNHSLQVANIAEAAADAIGADSLLVYVGALYHDVGKINKPEYFVENQTGGYNRHEKLSPAMSLLVIIGHVKNGIELAREYGLPRAITHFIESHHGTTLVEYFYHAARMKAEVADQGDVSEVEYRYPGPKPRSKEAAILMLSDAVESATRAMAEPNPSRIEALVRKLSVKRLEDGQFDQSELTFRELKLIEDAIINRLLAIHHSRISYPTASGRSADDGEPRTAIGPTTGAPTTAPVKSASA